MNPNKIAGMAFSFVQTAKEVPLSQVREFVPRGAIPGGPTSYRWFFIEHFPLRTFEFTLRDMMDADPEDISNEKRHDKIVAILESGGPEWPVVISADGLVFDGYHRIVAHGTMGHKSVSVLVGIKKPTARVELIDDSWHEAWNARILGSLA